MVKHRKIKNSDVLSQIAFQRVYRSLGKGEEVSLNPQPLPPHESSGLSNAGERVSLNPQPLPPANLAHAGGKHR